MERTPWKPWLAASVWGAALLSLWLYAASNERTLLDVMRDWLELISTHPYGPLLLLGVYVLNPFVPVPITILTVFSGYLFGAFWGTVYGLFAALVASSIGYGVGRFLAGETLAKLPLAQRLRERGFETVMTCRLIFVSGDFVNYASGAAKISFSSFLLATALGGSPSLFVAVLAGASIEGQFYFTALHINGWLVALSASLLVVSLIFSWYLRKREDSLQPLYAEVSRNDLERPRGF